ncbi:hypothetical protein [Paraburkholderia aromaticivorans]|uniref:DUF4148 domain-containing protein n=1 Tax=Paraburkholderia aromaticivorans TaxID=2026199 RepID=A0A248VPV4_9BURK|nr:hypothetical protein [Paraburkholderia aromaticivorans]ASW01057.1 hypothetical protein CJU94_22875 [Paraburkholderia aromaticivorans]
MHGESRKIVLTGLVVSALAIAAYVSQAGKAWLSTDEFGAARDDVPVHRTRGDTISGVVIAGPAARSDAASGTSLPGAAARGLQAARDSLQRNDLAAAQAQLDAIRAAHRDDARVRALQGDVQARADAAQRALAVERAGTTLRPASKPARKSSSPMRHGRSRENRFASHNQSLDGSSDARSQAALDNLVARLDSNGAPSAKTRASVGPPEASQPSALAARAKAPQSASSAPVAASASSGQQRTPTPLAASTSPARPQAELTAQTTVLSAPLVQSTSSGDTTAKTDGGPKTRAQVRAEIERARGNGSLPAFGNPDPAGPGGAPSLTGAPRP